MIVKAAEFHFPESVRIKYFSVVMRAAPPEGWPEGTVVMTEGRLPYKSFLQVIGASPKAEFRTEVGGYPDGDPRTLLSILEEIALNCPLKEEEALSIKRDYEVASRASGDARPALFVQGLIPPLWSGFEKRLLSFPSALILSLYTTADVQREILTLGTGEESPDLALRILCDPFSAGDLFNRLEREPERLKAMGYQTISDFLKNRSPFSYGRSRFLMRLAAAIPGEKREGLTSDQGEFLLRITSQTRERLFRGDSVSIDEEEIALKELRLKSRPEIRRLIRKLREKASPDAG